jgi:hypothetical protein
MTRDDAVNRPSSFESSDAWKLGAMTRLGVYPKRNAEPAVRMPFRMRTTGELRPDAGLLPRAGGAKRP